MNSHIPRFRTLALAATVMASALSFQLHAGPKYYIFEIPPISTSSSADSRAFGLSNVDSNGNLLVVGQADASSGSRAFVWSWEAAFGLSAFTTYDLNTLAGETSALSKANKVNSYARSPVSTVAPLQARPKIVPMPGSLMALAGLT